MYLFILFSINVDLSISLHWWVSYGFEWIVCVSCELWLKIGGIQNMYGICQILTCTVCIYNILSTLKTNYGWRFCAYFFFFCFVLFWWVKRIVQVIHDVYGMEIKTETFKINWWLFNTFKINWWLFNGPWGCCIKITLPCAFSNWIPAVKIVNFDLRSLNEMMNSTWCGNI